MAVSAFDVKNTYQKVDRMAAMAAMAAALLWQPPLH